MTVRFLKGHKLSPTSDRSHGCIIRFQNPTSFAGRVPGIESRSRSSWTTQRWVCLQSLPSQWTAKIYIRLAHETSVLRRTAFHVWQGGTIVNEHVFRLTTMVVSKLTTTFCFSDVTPSAFPSKTQRTWLSPKTFRVQKLWILQSTHKTSAGQFRCQSVECLEAWRNNWIPRHAGSRAVSKRLQFTWRISLAHGVPSKPSPNVSDSSRILCGSQTSRWLWPYSLAWSLLVFYALIWNYSLVDQIRPRFSFLAWWPRIPSPRFGQQSLMASVS